MKKTTLLTAMLCLLSAMTFAQGGKYKEKMEQVKSLKVAFITNELSLTSEEAAKFWPVYNAFDDRQRAMKKQKAGSFLANRDDKSLDKLTEKEASEFLAKMEKNDAEMFELKTKFTANLRTILPAVKIVKLKKAEDDFHRTLLKQYREKGSRK